jgi:hypothetical protein
VGAEGEPATKDQLLELGVHEAVMLQEKVLQVLLMAQQTFAHGAHRTGDSQGIHVGLCIDEGITHDTMHDVFSRALCI